MARIQNGPRRGNHLQNTSMPLPWSMRHFMPLCSPAGVGQLCMSSRKRRSITLSFCRRHSGNESPTSRRLARPLRQLSEWKAAKRGTRAEQHTRNPRETQTRMTRRFSAKRRNAEPARTINTSSIRSSSSSSSSSNSNGSNIVDVGEMIVIVTLIK